MVNKMEKQENKIIPLGTKVFDARYGWGVIMQILEGDYPLAVVFKEFSEDYRSDGSLFYSDKIPSLSLTEYDFKKGGFTSITEYDFDAPKIGDFGFFWDNEEQVSIVFSKLINLENGFFITERMQTYKHFSKDVPEFITKR